MFRDNTLRNLLDSGKPTVGTRLCSTSPLTTELVGMVGKYDYIEFLGEYVPYDQYCLEDIARAAELHNMGSLMKVDFLNRTFVAQKALASGFQGILFADHTCPAEVEQSIQATRARTPSGGRMGYLVRRWVGYQDMKNQDEYIEMMQAHVCAFMVEKKEAMDCIDEFCSVPGIDMVQFGPNDYAMSSGFNMCDEREKLRALEKKMIETAHKYHIRPRCEVNTAEEARYYLDLGVKDFNLGLEMFVLRDYWRREGDALLDVMAEKGVLR